MSPPHVGYPDDRPGRIADAGLDAGHIGLDIAAWCESSRHQLDGRLARSRLRGLRGWTQARHDGLVGAEFWRKHGDDIVLVGYLDVNRSRAQIADLRAKRAAAGSEGGKATAGTAPREDRGRFGHPDATPNATPNGHPYATPSADAAPTPIRARATKQPSKQVLGPSTSTSPSTSLGTGTATYSTTDWGTSWRPFLEAWQARGFRFPPTERQRETLWEIVDARPTDAGRWARSAPRGATAGQVVGHVLRCWKAFRSEVVA